MPGRNIASALAKLRQAVAFHSSGQLATAAHVYREVLALHPDQPDALHWLAVIEGQNGNTRLAGQMLARSAEINPRDPSTHGDLGTALRELNQREQALASYERALALKPDFVKVWCDRGVVLQELGRPLEAMASHDRALALQPDHVEALLKGAGIAIELGRTADALARSRRALALEENDLTRNLFAQVLRGVRFTHYDTQLLPLLIRAIGEPWGRPYDLGAPGVSLLKCRPEVAACIARARHAGADALSLDELFGPSGPDAVAADPLLLCLLQNLQLGDLELERFLTAARRGLLHMLGAGEGADVSPPLLAFMSALARQCFINEYVYACGETELMLAAALRDRLIAALVSGAPVPAPWIAVVGCYFPLGTLPAAAALLARTWPEAITALLAQQVGEPLEERRLRREVPALTSIDDGVSRLVREQYEENPYPRWVKCFGHGRNVSVDGYVGSRFPFANFEPLGARDGEVSILIAGCGTGQHPIDTALLLRDSRILAIDLSVASLCYAKRKTKEIGLTNIDYAQADILKLGSIGRTFELIESMGVLHHLADPMAGWRVLQSLLRPGGFMSLGLYSECARRGVVAARRFIAERGYTGTAADIRKCRQDIIAMTEDGLLSKVVSSPDFFGTSTCRDLLFHVQEHRYTLQQLRREIDELGLMFMGFDLEPPIRAQYAARFPKDSSMNDLDCWDTFESENPDTFAGMYQFWVQKPL